MRTVVQNCTFFNDVITGRICIPFQDVLGVELWLDLDEQIRDEDFKLRCSAPPSGETMHQTQNVFEVQEHAQGLLSPCFSIILK